MYKVCTVLLGTVLLIVKITNRIPFFLKNFNYLQYLTYLSYRYLGKVR